MKISLSNKNSSDLKKDITRIVLIEKGSERFVEKDTGTELHIAAGKFDEVTPRTLRTLVRTIIRTAKKHKLTAIALTLRHEDFPKTGMYDDAWFYQTIAENAMLADYEYTVYKSKKEKETLKEVVLLDILTTDKKRGLEQGLIIGSWANHCRDLANTPGGDMTPQILGNEAKRLLKGTKAKVTVLGKEAIKKLKMGGLLGVGKGAKADPAFIVIEYFGKGKGTSEKGKKDNAPIVFVGKGITFDTGGLQVKPGMSMYEMHMDMSGGAAVIAAIGAIAKLGLKKNVIGLIPAAENALSDEAIRPGDVITSMSGKTVDVLHTDAEGRLVLMDALHYARRYNPKLVIDVATLTGAALVAVGLHAHAIMTKDRELEDTLRDLGEKTGDYCAPLPLWDEFKQYVKGVHGDIANIPANDMKWGGAIIGGIFLSHFTEGMRWAHIDMAPRMTAVGSDKLTKGATGEPTRLLVNIAENY